ncbi:MAG TPA: Uma2 family endonuclease [Isosphaeraceae bacterium]|jgi:Uma2 family endonuclease|nr:Uma2 family endonuclease [Isosphaeraceae bacterium]
MAAPAQNQRQTEPVGTTKVSGSQDSKFENPVYDRSSLEGDYMVMIAGQTEEDYFRRAPENQFCEFIDGIVYMPSPVSVSHQQLVQFVFHLLDGFRSERDCGPILTGPAVFKLGIGRDVEPDLFMLPVGGREQLHGQYAEGPAALIVEVLSQSTRDHDLTHKAALYREDATEEIWFIDERDRLLLVECRALGDYQANRLENGVYESQAIQGFWLDVAWLWSNPLPNPRRCLEQILAGPPARLGDRA